MKPWTIQQEIKKRVQKESTYAWANTPEDRTPPKVESKRIPKSVGLWNIIRQLAP